MKAVRFAAYGGPDVLRLCDVDEPHAGPGQVRVAVRAAGVNGIDWKIRAGLFATTQPVQLPAGVGLDAAGIVDEVGDGVTDVVVGDAVFGTGSSTYAEFAVLSYWALKPAGLPFQEAAGYPVPVATASHVLTLAAPRAGDTVVIAGWPPGPVLPRGAHGGVGAAAVQIARERGMTVIGIGSEQSLRYLRSLGAAPVEYGPDLVARVTAVAPGGVRSGIDIGGWGVVGELVQMTGDPAAVVSIADCGASSHGAVFATGLSGQRKALTEAARLFRAGTFRLPVARTFSLRQAAHAHQASAAGHTPGRFVLTVS